tara:strand:+ start:199 stop:411 length:213 start_codon:yes stop_codon:yes gene_type:complete
MSKKDKGHYTPASVLQMAETVFESQEIALEWLESPVNALNGERPSQLLKTSEGCARVYQILNKLETGDFS